MVPTVNSPDIPLQELQEHQETFHSFSKLVLFAVLHIVLVLACLAMAFLGHIPVLGLLLGLGGTLALLVAFAITS
ncbi:aa3-type cytochrome c oxidase subunit IV [Reyranella sp.]|uniref:aa3-type cytochrome c oxidase subunit IV n=1 Tax=Reyranella sp. TaxID=1929291 RepID=UPI0025DB0F9F|nr:aa3-type cytochrome c oxidase subunit IV [Reyranella sp.]